MADLVGQQLGNYRLLRVLGRGAFASVYLGKHQYLERSAAIKVLHVQIEPAGHESFRREARTIAQLDHPHIIGVHDFDIEDQTPYLVMEYMPGGTLRSCHPKGTQLSFEQIITYVKQIASALDYAHHQRVIHRDIKPENILLNSKHEVMLSDFGIAVVQHTLDTLSMQNSAGTPIYMAPEQIQHKPCAASDQYALGVMIYEWLCGEPPFHGALFEVLSQHLHKPPPSLCARLSQLPPAVEDAIFRTLVKDPEQRFNSVTNFATVLSEALLATQPLPLSGFVEHGPQDLVALPTTPMCLRSMVSPSEQEPSNEAKQLHLGTAPHIDRNEVVQRVSPQPVTHRQKQTKPSPARTTRGVSVEEQNRKRMRERLQRTYEELFAQSLQGVTQMELGLSAKPDAVQNAATLLFRTSTRPEQLLPQGTSILHVYDQAIHELLILGAPGAGKSTLLVELARQLIVRTETDETHPLPVILPLSSWAVKRPPLHLWLAEQAAQIYNIPKSLARRWVDEDQLLLLLDGLDEMEETARPDCIAAINAYHRDHLQVPLVVCSRQAEYEEAAQHQRLALQSAVMVQPLTGEQIEQYLTQVGEPLSALCRVLSTNHALASVATTPLMVHILILTYQGASVQLLSTQNAQLQQQVWTDYLTRMVERKGNVQRYPLAQTRSWLGWLAHQMRVHNQTVFYLEHMQPDWLTDRQRYIYYWFGVRLPAILIGALLSIFIGWLISNGSSWSTLLQEAILGGILGGLLCPMPSRDITRAAAKVHLRWGTALLISIGVGLAIGFSTGWGIDFIHKNWLLDGFIYGVMLSFTSLLLQSLLSTSPRRSAPATRYSSGRWAIMKGLIQQRHLQHALLVAFLIGLRFGLSFGLFSMLIGMILQHLQEGIYPTERVSLSWQNLRNRLFAPAHLRRTCMLTGCIVVLIMLITVLTFVVLIPEVSRGLLDFTLGSMLVVVLGGILIVALIVGLSVGLLYWLVLGLYQSITQERMENQDRRIPNQGIRQSLRNSLLLGLIGGAMIGGMRFGLIAVLSHQPSGGLSYFLPLFVMSSILAWALMGGLAVWRHYLVRFLLGWTQTFPWNVSRFLDDAMTRILLLRLGGGYRFTHRLLLDSLADATKHNTELRSPPMPTHFEQSSS